MAPAKFDDLVKPAKDILTDDYQEKGMSFKAKAKTNFEGVGALTGGADGKSGATLTTAVDLDAGNPAKLTWKFPKPLGLAGIAFDKFEMDKKGGYKLEASVDHNLHGAKDLKIDCKSDLASLNSLALGVTYTGMKDLLAKAEFKAMNPGDYTAEIGYAVAGGAQVSVKSTQKDVAAVGAKYASGALSCSVFTKDAFSAFTLHGAYKVNGDANVACTYDIGGKSGGQFVAGAAFKCCPGTSVKAKVAGSSGSDLNLSTSVKHELAKGCTVTAGAKMPMASNKPWSYGVAFNIE